MVDEEIGFIEEEWNCGLLALLDAFSLSGLNIDYDTLRENYFNLGFELYSFGITSVHLALLAKEFDFDVTLKTSSKWLKGIYEYANNRIRTRVRLSYESSTTLKAMKMFIKLGGKIYFTTRAKKGNISDVNFSIRKGNINILCVNANQYYGIDEEWNHYIVVKKNDNPKYDFAVVDSLRNIGELWYDDWDKYLKKAERYDWQLWCGDLIELTKNN